jgi:tetratricopeptide (TPR) repeat protein
LLGETQLASKRSTEALHCFAEALRVFTQVKGKEDVLVADVLEKTGNAQIQLSDYAKATESLKRALKIYRDQFGASSQEVARVLLAMGKAESRKGNWNLSIDFYRQSLHISKQNGDNAAMGKALFEVGVALEARGDQGALTCFTEILRFIDPDKDWAIAADARNRIGHLLMERGEIEQSLAEFEQSQSLLKQHAGDETVEMAQTIHNIAGAYEALGKYEESKIHFSEALRIFKERLGPNDLSVALALNNLGINCTRRREYVEALQLCNEALRIRREELGPEHIDTCDTLFNIATMLDEFGKLEEAMKFFTDVVAMYRKTTGSDSVEVAHCFQSIGVLHTKLLDDDLAIRALVEALRIYRLSDAETLSIASVLFHLGKIYLSRGECEKAIESLTQCLKTRDEELEEVSTDIADACDLLGLAHTITNSNSTALNFYRRAYKIYSSVLGATALQSVTVLTKIAGALLEDDNYEQALVAFQECLTILRSEKGDESDEVANVLTNIGVIYNKQVDYEEALKFLTEALKIRAKTFGRDHIKVARTLFEIGSVLQEWGDSDEVSNRL